MDTIQVIGLTRFGDAGVLGMHLVPLQAPGPNEARVMVRAAAVNPADILFREGRTAARRHAGGGRVLVPGMELAGVVDAAGQGSRWAVGDRVAGVTLPGARPLAGAYASRAILADDSLVHLPAGTPYAAGSTLLMNGLTALRALDLARLQPGATLGVTGGAGAVGGYAIQLAAARGLRVVADALPRDADLIRGLGAEETVLRGPGVAQRFAAAMKGPLDAVIDAAVVGPALLDAVKDGGFFGLLRPAEWTSVRGIEAALVVGVEYARDARKLEHLRECLQAGSLSLRVAGTYPPERAADAHRELQAGGVRGRLVLEWSTISA